jgi:CRP/FNR family cyclic AMP-dependent transcriptional regulator
MPARRLLDTTELFANLPAPVIDQLTARTETRTLERGDLLFAQGDASTELFVVVEGKIAIAYKSTDGRESLVAVMEPGGLFGELGLFDDGPRSADARALTPATVVALGFEHVRAVLREQPDLLWIVVRLLALRLRATDEALADAVFLDVPARTAKRLLELAGDDDDVELPMTQEDLAGLVGASRERVNKALALFVKLGWVEATGRGRYRILEREELTLRANP